MKISRVISKITSNSNLKTKLIPFIQKNCFTYVSSNKSIFIKNENFTKNIMNNSYINTNNKNIYNLSKFNFSKRTHEQATFNEHTTKFKSDFQNPSTTIKQNTPENNDNQKPDSMKITTKLLCDLIGCKHYLSNEEIPLEEDILVNVYDESDKFLGKQSFGEAFRQAKDIGKDVILRNEKVVPPVIKIMKYKVELVKRLLKKLGKTVESEKKENLKYMTLSLNINENDFNNKESKIKELLAHFSYIRVVIPCDISNNEQVLKASSLLNSLSNDLSEFCKVKAGPIRQKQKKQKIENFDTKITDSIQKINKQDKDIQDAYEIAKITEVNNDKDLDYISCIYIDYESLLLDFTGINYEKLLENVNLEGLVKGITKTHIVNKVTIYLQIY